MEARKAEKKAFHFGPVRLALSRTFCYIVLALLTVLCLFSFYMLIINATRQHGAIMSGFSWLPGKSFLFNANNLFQDTNIPTLRALGNSPGHMELFSYLFFDKDYFQAQIDVGIAAADQAIANGWLDY